MTDPSRTLVAVATYNEIENLPRLVDEIFRFAPDVEVLVIDDNSPDGTGRWCADRSRDDPRVHCLHRSKKLGLGTATVAGMKYALDGNYDLLVTMDADFSHHPRYLPDLRAAIDDRFPNVDVAIGSRYVPGGDIDGWPRYRRWMSRLINAYARLLLALPVRDCSGAFRVYRCGILEQIEFDRIRSRGYSYLEEILWLLHRRGAGFQEVPIVFTDRTLGETKINWREAAAAVWILTRLGIAGRFRRGANRNAPDA